MHNFFRNFFLVVVSISTFQAYSMENNRNILSTTTNQEADKKLITILDSLKRTNSEQDWQNLKDIIIQGAGVDTILPDRSNALMMASYLGNIDIVNFLLEHKANVNASSQNGTTPLHAAVFSPNTNRTDIVIKLLENGANPNATTTNKDTPLIFSIDNRYNDLIIPLIERGAHINEPTNLEMDALLCAVYTQNTTAATILCKAGASPNYPNNLTIFHCLAREPNPSMLRNIMTSLTFNSEQIDDSERNGLFAQVPWKNGWRIKKSEGEKIKDTLKYARLLFNRYNLPLEVQLKILSTLPIEYYFYAYPGLPKKLYEQNHNQYARTIFEVGRRLVSLKKIFGKKNNVAGRNIWEKIWGITPLEILSNRPGSKYIKPFLNGEKLYKHYKIFINTFPNVPEGNLIGEMYKNCEESLQKQDQKNKA